jgi:hypothetical protein
MYGKIRIISAITAGSLAMAAVAIGASSGSSQTMTHAALAARAEAFPPVILDNCPTLHTGYPLGGCVAQLQTDLNLVSGKHILDVDGIFGSANSQTYKAVIAFQGAHGLQQDGVVGPVTKKALDAAIPEPTSIPESLPPTPVPAPSTATPGSQFNVHGAPGIPEAVFNPGPFTDSVYLQRSLIQRIPTSSSDSTQAVATFIAGAICSRYFPEVPNPSCTGVLGFLIAHGGYMQLIKAKEQNSCLRIRWLGPTPLSGVVVPSADSNPAYCLSVADPGFEGQPSDGVSTPWLTEGPDPKGIDRGKGLSHSGSNNAWIRTNSRNWNAIDQVVGVSHDRKYRLTVWIRSSGVPGTGYFGVRDLSSNKPIAETTFGTVATYQKLTVVFDSAANSSVRIFAGYWAPGSDSWIQADDIDIS